MVFVFVFVFSLLVLLLLLLLVVEGEASKLLMLRLFLLTVGDKRGGISLVAPIIGEGVEAVVGGGLPSFWRLEGMITCTW